MKYHEIVTKINRTISSCVDARQHGIATKFLLRLIDANIHFVKMTVAAGPSAYLENVRIKETKCDLADYIGEKVKENKIKLLVDIKI